MKNLVLFILLICSFSILLSQHLSTKGNMFTDIAAFAISPPLRSVEPLPPVHYPDAEEEFDHMQRGLPMSPVKEKSMLNNFEASLLINDPILIMKNFDGVSNVNNVPNPDTEGDVGLNHYMQMVKSSFAIWDKEGNLLYGPAENKTIWNSLPGPWHDNMWTDPVVIYDPIADRWVASAMVYDLYVEYWEMIAVSATPDPLGEWNCYALHFWGMPDYPKLGVWPDGYYLTINEYFISQSINYLEAVGLMVFNREDMINGNPDPRIIYFRHEGPTQYFLTDPASFLPSDLDGPLPPDGTPNYLITVRDDAWGYDFDHLWLWQCIVDWEDTNNCVFEEVSKIQTAPFDARWDMGTGWVPMPGTNTKLHGLGHFLMYRLQYRNFDEYQTLMCNHTINIGNDQAAVRWYELRNYGQDWSIYQSGTFAPDDESRWMASIAMDKDGNIGLGYSASSSTLHPTIRVSGRGYNDIMGAITFPESDIAVGGGNQATNVRWGDYSMLAVDPVDDLTFWYTQEFLPTTGWNTWRTRVASFQLHRNLDPLHDSLIFNTYEECFEGLDISWTNNSQYPVTISDIEQEGGFSYGAIWYIDPWNINLPLTLQPGESINLNIKVDFITDFVSGYVMDTLDLITDYKNHILPIFLNEDLLVGTADYTDNKMPLISINPNPTKDQTNIEIITREKGYLEIALYSIRSEKIWDIQPLLLKPSGTYYYQLGSKIGKGLYFIRIRFNDKVIIKRLIKI